MGKGQRPGGADGPPTLRAKDGSACYGLRSTGVSNRSVVDEPALEEREYQQDVW